MATLQKICVYCGSGCGNNPVFAQEARLLGQEMAKANIGLVYGGGSVGLMGILAKSVLENGGHVTGIIPGFLKDKEVMLADVQDLLVTGDMHERKRKMFDAAQAFVALPGGIGTLEELVEMLTWAQLGQHKKPVLLANIEGFWDPLAKLLDHMRKESFIRQDMAVSYLSAHHARDIVPMLHEAVASLPDADIASTTLQDSLSTL
ncbi:TIGR00730 family Rossman fold protein [Cohaesibacter haloalkalitolerans]|uniref:LOG family protein n=1 Tax=Cohaesibacter haloalkalitolerans TaxID=1162980 RepID=UPI000E64D67F|nr:TIGR00730 family Rossman fold protein [Cohaesibacter haloalkalitolerans]